jgi:hypothetical protein
VNNLYKFLNVRKKQDSTPESGVFSAVHMYSTVITDVLYRLAAEAKETRRCELLGSRPLAVSDDKGSLNTRYQCNYRR